MLGKPLGRIKDEAATSEGKPESNTSAEGAAQKFDVRADW